MSSNEETNKESPPGMDERGRGFGHGRHGHHGHGPCGGRRRWLKIPFIAAAVLIKGALVMFLWNALIPDLFHGPELIYCQALGLMILAKLLVGFGGGFGHWGRHHHHRGGFGHKEHWMKMSPEEREKLREEMNRRCGWFNDKKQEKK